MVQHPVGEDVEPALGRHDGEALGQVPLRLGEEVRVEGELEDGAGPRLGGELGVDDLVGPGAEVARNFDAPEDVRAPGPPALLERPLGDDVQTLLHRLEGAVDGRRAAQVGEVLDLEALCLERGEVALLVLEPALLERLPARVVRRRDLRQPVGDSEVQAREVPAAEVVREVGRGEDQLAVEELHEDANRRPSGAGWPVRTQWKAAVLLWAEVACGCRRSRSPFISTALSSEKRVRHDTLSPF